MSARSPPTTPARRHRRLQAHVPETLRAGAHKSGRGGASTTAVACRKGANPRTRWHDLVVEAGCQQHGVPREREPTGAQVRLRTNPTHRHGGASPHTREETRISSKRRTSNLCLRAIRSAARALARADKRSHAARGRARAATGATHVGSHGKVRAGVRALPGHGDGSHANVQLLTQSHPPYSSGHTKLTHTALSPARENYAARGAARTDAWQRVGAHFCAPARCLGQLWLRPSAS